MAGGGRKKRPVKAKRKPTGKDSLSSSLLFNSPLPNSRPGRSPFGSAAAASGSGNSDRAKPSASKIGCRKPTRNAFRYDYSSVDPQENLHSEYCGDSKSKDAELDELHPIVLVDSKQNPIVAFVDALASKEPINVDIAYDYRSNLGLDDSSHKGLGFCDEDNISYKGLGFCDKDYSTHGGLGFNDELKATLSCAGSSSKKMDGREVPSFDFTPRDKEMHVHERNSGFLSIGGMKLYTEDISDEESDQEDDGTSPDDGSDNSEDIACSDSDIDEEVAEDYLEGIGGSNEVLDAKWLVGRVLDVSSEDDDDDKDDSSSSSFDETTKKLGGMALQEASREYGMKKPESRKKYFAKSCKARASTSDWAMAMDDLALVKDPRIFSSKKKLVAQFPQSWPYEAQKSKNFRKFPGAKKKHRKEMIALKRRERMRHRGVDLEQINLVQRLAAIYRLRSGCQGSGKKRFVIVMRTQYTCMPSSIDKLRLEKLIGACNEDDDFVVNEDPNIKHANGDKNWKKLMKRSGMRALEHHRVRSSKNSANRDGSSEANRKKQSRKEGSSYADKPVSFVSSGLMQPEMVEIGTVDSEEKNDTKNENAGGDSASKLGAFEVHTKGFGSKMMAKMGFVEGAGLGKDGQGMAEPIEVIKRPKSLGLGMNFSETGSDSDRKGGQGVVEPIEAIKQPKLLGSGSKFSRTISDSDWKELQRIGAFEKYTKGFGSKMMAKMGFIEGAGLGKDSQGMVNPLVAVRRPKLQGLGAKG
ncbi:uncharacterized protein LOC131157905 [Malania oleifera]|uniref:uncharacterized protein LOC131157905 n=1 Tax=Malania oleifera TaxID=397392 RepID=UPI0025ADB3FE|nr:uncharacterized protein LOC131157905 [Malania oleifera]